MKKRVVIIIIVLISICAAAITAQYFTNMEERTMAPVELTEAPQTAAPTESPTEKSTAAETERTESTGQTAAPTEKPTQSTSETETTKPRNTTTITKQKTTATTTTTTTTTAPTTEAATTATTTTAPPEATANTKAQKITVTISINCNIALDKVDGLPESGYFLAPCKYTAQAGDTVFDVLEAVAKENGISLKYQSKTYIQAINGLAEKALDGAGGWTYKVNGVKPNRAAVKYELSNGDIIEWYYAMSPYD